jgi:hypothetical protein
LLSDLDRAVIEAETNRFQGRGGEQEIVEYGGEDDRGWGRKQCEFGIQGKMAEMVKTIYLVWQVR